MNTLETYEIVNPDGKTDMCPKFTIDNIVDPFIFRNITSENTQYTFSVWVKSEAEGKIYLNGNPISTSEAWVKHVVIFTAKKANFEIYFGEPGTYYLYHSQLERGNKVTDWSKSPDDMDAAINDAQDTANKADNAAQDAANRLDVAESMIRQLSESISMLVTDHDGTTLLQQTADNGWSFSMAQTQESLDSMSALLAELTAALGSTTETVDKLNGAFGDVDSSLELVKITTYEDEPCIILGESDSDFKAIVTNTRIIFFQGTSTTSYISNNSLSVKKAVVEEELQQGPFVWKIRSNGNMGLVWKGVTE